MQINANAKKANCDLVKKLCLLSTRWQLNGKNIRFHVNVISTYHIIMRCDHIYAFFSRNHNSQKLKMLENHIHHHVEAAIFLHICSGLQYVLIQPHLTTSWIILSDFLHAFLLSEKIPLPTKHYFCCFYTPISTYPTAPTSLPHQNRSQHNIFYHIISKYHRLYRKTTTRPHRHNNKKHQTHPHFTTPTPHPDPSQHGYLWTTPQIGARED